MDFCIYIGQSGRIIDGICENHEYFIVSLLYVQNKFFVEDVFKKARLKAVNRMPELREILRTTGEIKGFKEKLKASVYKKIFEKCGEGLALHLLVFDNQEFENSFRQISQRAFNYIMRRYLDVVSVNGGESSDCGNIELFIDETKTQTKSKFILEEYLNTELNLFKKLCNGSLQVNYCCEKDYLCLQLSDYLANTLYRELSKKSVEAKANLDIIKDGLKGAKFISAAELVKGRENLF
jgi:hypothetical protein